MLNLWAHVIDSCGPGCIDLEFDKFLSDDADRKSFLDLAISAMRRIERMAASCGKVPMTTEMFPVHQQSIHFDDWVPIDQIKSAFSHTLAILLNSDT